eukprot:812318-Pyramimonas_sp.AAC.1
MKRPSRSPNFDRVPWVWSRGDGLGRRADPTNHPPAECLTEADYQPIDKRGINRTDDSGSTSI